MIPAFAHSEMSSAIWIKRGIIPTTLAPGTTNTYETANGGASIDSWDGGNTLFQNMMIVIDVASASGTGGVVVSLYDSPIALTNSNGDANAHLALDLATITAVGLYYAEVQFSHVFPSTYTRVVAHPTTAHSVQRYLSIRAVATTHTYLMSVLCLFGNNLRKFVSQDATVLAKTWVAS